MVTMNDLYEDGSAHLACRKCSLCKDCGDCDAYGCGNPLNKDVNNKNAYSQIDKKILIRKIIATKHTETRDIGGTIPSTKKLIFKKD